MKRLCALFLFTFAANLLVAVSPTRAADKGTVVDFDGLKSTAPETWGEEKPGQMRYVQFKIPAPDKDTKDGQLVVFKGLGGSAKDNIARWQGMFLPPEGKKVEDIAKVTEFKMAGRDATRLDIAGIYKFKAAPFDPNSKEEKLPDYKMIAIQFDGPKNIYHIRFVGPAKTIDKNKEAFETWIKGFKE